MVIRGLRNREVGASLNIAEGTVKMHLHSIYKKLKVDGRLQLALRSRQTSVA